MDEENNIRYSIEKNTKVEHSNLIIIVQSKRTGGKSIVKVSHKLHNNLTLNSR